MSSACRSRSRRYALDATPPLHTTLWMAVGGTGLESAKRQPRSRGSIESARTTLSSRGANAASWKACASAALALVVKCDAPPAA